MNARTASFYKGKKVLITGATGFIGSHLTSTMLQQGAQVFCLARKKHEVGTGAELCLSDLTDHVSLDKLLERIQPEIIFNLAAAGLRDGTQEELAQQWSVTASGAVNLACQSLRHKVSCLIQLGSSQEYGDGPTPFVESQVDRPVTAYSAAKCAATRYLLSAHALHNLPVLVVRPTVVYGPGQSGDMFMPYLIRHYLGGIAPELTPCQQTRDFLYIDDLISALLLLGSRFDLAGQIFNVASGRSIRLAALAEVVARLCGHRGDLGIGKRNYRAREIMEHRQSNEKIGVLAGWHPQVEIEEGLHRTVAWWRERTEQQRGRDAGKLERRSSGQTGMLEMEPPSNS